MSLDTFFRDREARANMRKAVNESVDIGAGTCSSCGTYTQQLFDVGNQHICSNCRSKIVDAANDYSKVYNSVSYTTPIDESYIAPDMTKLQADANAKFGGSIPDLLKSYNLTVRKDWNDKISKGRIYITDQNVQGGKTRINQFIIDYDCSFLSDKAAYQLVPDKDGTTAPLKVNGKLISGQPSAPSASKSIPPTSSTQKQSTSTQKPSQPSQSTKLTTPTQPVQQPSNQSQISSRGGTQNSSSLGLRVDGSGTSFSVYIAKNVVVNLSQKSVNGSDVDYDCTVQGINYRFNFKAKGVFKNQSVDITKVADSFGSELKNNPALLFPFFDGDGKYKLAYRDYLTLSPVFSDKSDMSFQPVVGGLLLTKPDVQFIPSTRALFNASLFDKEANSFYRGLIKRALPDLEDGDYTIHTSFGNALLNISGLIESRGDVAGAVLLFTVGKMSFTASFSDRGIGDFDEWARNCIWRELSNIIPGWSRGVPVKGGAMSFDLSTTLNSGDTLNISSSVSRDTFLISGDLTFNTDAQTSSGYWSDNFLYKDLSLTPEEFIKTETVKKIAQEDNSGGNDKALKQSAQDKLKSPARKVALLSRMSDNILSSLKDYLSVDISDLSCEVESFEINQLGVVSLCTFRISDFDFAVSQTSAELRTYLDLENVANFLKVKTVDEANIDEYGPSVVYTVTNFDEFYLFAKLSVLESLIISVFGILRINESGRKRILL